MLMAAVSRPCTAHEFHLAACQNRKIMIPVKQAGKTGRWAARQNRDPFVQAARRGGFRARSVFKLKQIDRKYRLIKPDSLILDLGAAPGSWCQYAVRQIGAAGRIVAVDLLAMEAVEKVNFIHGDFTNDKVVEEILAAFDGRPPDLVLSDMAPNISGISSTDQAHMETLQQAVLEFCRYRMRPGGALLTKLFAGESESIIRKQLGDCFARTHAIKPDASRPQSREIYLLARGCKGRATKGVKEA